MNRKALYLILTSWLASGHTLLAQTDLLQSDTLAITDDFSETELNSHLHYFNITSEISVDSALNIFKLKSRPIETLNKIHFGPVTGFYWLKVTIQNSSPVKQNIYFQIRQPHIYRMIFHRVKKDSVSVTKSDISDVSETGIRFNFYQRPSPHRFFDFPFSCNPGESYTILMMVHHINSLTLPIYLVSSDKLHQNYYRQNMVWGYWVGFLSFCALFALTALIVLRKRIFLWYFFYIFSAVLYGYTDQGYGFQYIFPGSENLEALVIIQLAVYIFIFLIKFSQSLLETRKYLPGIHRILNGIFYFLLILLLAGVVVQEIMFRISPFVLPIVNLVVLAGLILLAISGVRSLFTNRIIAIYYLTAYVSLVCASISSTLIYGFGLFQYNGPNPILIAYFFEAILLSVALVILFNQTQTERNRLNEQVATQQKKMYQQYIDGIEKERSRIAGELHDDIGSRLSHLKMELQNSTENATHQLDEIIQDIRHLSHDLAPPVAHLSGLMPLVEKMIMDARNSSRMDIKLQRFDYQECFTPDEVQQIYRILQESIHNITEHAEASHADIQFFGYENELIITIEDDGKGFDPKLVHGFGLNQITVRTESLGGKIEINSRPGKGTILVIEIPVKNNK